MLRRSIGQSNRLSRDVLPACGAASCGGGDGGDTMAPDAARAADTGPGWPGRIGRGCAHRKDERKWNRIEADASAGGAG